MTRLLGQFWRFLPWALFFAALVWSLGTQLELAEKRHTQAYQSYLIDIHHGSCVRREDVIREAEKRGWEWSPADMQFCVKPPELSDWIKVEVEPPVPFGPLGQLFAFDAEGCLADFMYYLCEP